MKIFNKSILVCSILCAMFISCKTTEIVISNDASELEIIQTAQTAFDNGDKEGALKCYNKLLQLYGVNTATYVEGRYEIGHILLKEKKYEEAADIFLEILEIYDNSPYGTIPRNFERLAYNDLLKIPVSTVEKVRAKRAE